MLRPWQISQQRQNRTVNIVDDPTEGTYEFYSKKHYDVWEED